jgi:hypothetical protein
METFVKLTQKEAAAIREILSHYIFSDDGEYNNDEVIDALDTLDDAIERSKHE